MQPGLSPLLCLKVVVYSNVRRDELLNLITPKRELVRDYPPTSTILNANMLQRRHRGIKRPRRQLALRATLFNCFSGTIKLQLRYVAHTG